MKKVEMGLWGCSELTCRNAECWGVLEGKDAAFEWNVIGKVLGEVRCFNCNLCPWSATCTGLLIRQSKFSSCLGWCSSEGTLEKSVSNMVLQFSGSSVSGAGSAACSAHVLYFKSCWIKFMNNFGSRGQGQALIQRDSFDFCPSTVGYLLKRITCVVVSQKEQFCFPCLHASTSYCIVLKPSSYWLSCLYVS